MPDRPGAAGLRLAERTIADGSVVREWGPRMVCQEAGFMNASCRIEVHPRDVPVGAPAFKAVMYLIEGEGSLLRPVVFPDGSRAVIPGDTPQLAMNNAIAWLSNRYGSMTEYTHACLEPAGGAALGEPVVLN